MKQKFSKLLKNKIEFVEILEENTKNYKGEYVNVIRKAPEIYHLLCDLLRSKSISKIHRNKIVSAIAYFILKKDVFPEELFGSRGYVDDLLISLYVLREIRDEYDFEELSEYWEGNDRTLKKLLNEDFEKLNKKYGYILNDILKFVGLKD